MRTASSELQAFLLTRQSFFSADLYTLELSNGQTLLITSADQPITIGGQTFLPTFPAVKRGTWSVKYTQEVPVLTFQLYSTGSDFRDTLGNVINLKEAAHNGIFDYAYISLQRLVMPTFGDTSLGAVLLFGGRTAGIQITALGVAFNAKGDNVLMQQYMPKNTFQLGCIHMLYDAGCALVKADFTYNNYVGSSGVNSVFVPWGTPPANPSYFVNGVLTITSGTGEGQSRSVIGANSSGMALVYPLYTVPSPGDTIAVSQGCMKNTTVCHDQFTNLTHYRGFPYIPPVETAT